MALDGMHVGNYGFPIVLRCIEDGAAANISSFGTIHYTFRDPSGNATTVAGSAYTDGTDGKVSYTVGSALLTTAGDWHVQAKLTKAGELIYSEALFFTVGGVLA
jgi:hypothetical protein